MHFLSGLALTALISQFASDRNFLSGIRATDVPGKTELSADWRKVFATEMTVPSERAKPADDPTFDFEDSPACDRTFKDPPAAALASPPCITAHVRLGL
jgi:hypothetical protein